MRILSFLPNTIITVFFVYLKEELVHPTVTLINTLAQGVSGTVVTGVIELGRSGCHLHSCDEQFGSFYIIVLVKQVKEEQCKNQALWNFLFRFMVTSVHTVTALF